MDQVPAAAATSTNGEPLRASDATAGHEDSGARHFAGHSDASMSTPGRMEGLFGHERIIGVDTNYKSFARSVDTVLANSSPSVLADDLQHILGLSNLELPAVRERIQSPLTETEWQAVGSTEIDQQAGARQGGDNEGSLMASSGVNQAGSKRKAASEASLSQSEDMRNVPRRAGKNRKTTQSASLDPSVSVANLLDELKRGNTFPDWKRVEEVLDHYASATGFSFGIRNCKKLADKTTVSKKTWVCSRAGEPRSTSKKKPGSSSKKCQCPVSVNVRRRDDGTLYISKSELRHIHTPAPMAKEERARYEELETCALKLLRQASESEVVTKLVKFALCELQSRLSQSDASSGQDAVPESSNCDAVVNRAQTLAVHTTEAEIQQHDDERVETTNSRDSTQASTTSLSNGPSNRGARLDTLVSPDSSVDDVERARVQLSPNFRRECQQRTDMSRLLRVLEVLRQGFHPPEDYLRQSLTWNFVRLLSGVLSTFDESQMQHTELCNAIDKGLPFVVQMLREKIQDTGSIQLISDALGVLRSLSSKNNANTVVKSRALPHLLQSLDSDIPKLQSQAALCLCDIASTSTDLRKTITESCPPEKVLLYLQSSSAELRSAAESLLRSLVDFPNVMEQGEFGPVLTQQLVDVLSSILLRRSRDEVRKYTDMNGGGDLVLVNKAAPISFWRIFEIQTGKPFPKSIDRVRVIREVGGTLLEVKSVARDAESLEYQFYRVKETELRPVHPVGVEDEDENPDENDLVSEEELEIVEYCSALKRLSFRDSEVDKKLVDLGRCPPLVKLLYISNSTVVCSSVFQLLHNILVFRVSFPQAIIDSKLLEVMPSFLQSRSCELRDQALNLLRGISSCEKAVMLAMIQSSALVCNLLETMEWGVSITDLKAADVLSNMIQHATPEFATQMIDRDVIKMFSRKLDYRSSTAINLNFVHAIDVLMAMNPIESRHAWEECDLLSVIGEHCNSGNRRLRKKATKFMKKWDTNKRDRDNEDSDDSDDDDEEDDSDSDEKDSDDEDSDGEGRDDKDSGGDGSGYGDIDE